MTTMMMIRWRRKIDQCGSQVETTQTHRFVNSSSGCARSRSGARSQMLLGCDLVVLHGGSSEGRPQRMPRRLRLTEHICASPLAFAAVLQHRHTAPRDEPSSFYGLGPALHCPDVVLGFWVAWRTTLCERIAAIMASPPRRRQMVSRAAPLCTPFRRCNTSGDQARVAQRPRLASGQFPDVSPRKGAAVGWGQPRATRRHRVMEFRRVPRGHMHCVEDRLPFYHRFDANFLPTWGPSSRTGWTTNDERQCRVSTSSTTTTMRMRRSEERQCR